MPAQQGRRGNASLLGRPQQQHRARGGGQLKAARGGQVHAGAIRHHQRGGGCLQRHLGCPQAIMEPVRVHQHAGLPQSRIKPLPPATPQTAQRTQQRSRMRPCMATHPQHPTRRWRLHDRTPRQMQGHGHGRKPKARGIPLSKGLMHAMPRHAALQIQAWPACPKPMHGWISVRSRRKAHVADGRPCLQNSLHAFLHVWYPLGYDIGLLRQGASGPGAPARGRCAHVGFSMRCHSA